MKNLEIRTAILAKGIRYYRVAEELHIAEFTLSRWLRQELIGEKKARVMAAIEKVADAQGR